jgi:serine/threonine protein kinase
MVVKQPGRGLKSAAGGGPCSAARATSDTADVWESTMAVRIESQAEPIPGYKLIERIGGGGFGEVWKCEAPGGLHKAIKFVYGDIEELGEDGQRAEQELKALSRVKTIRHPYILSLERFDIINNQLIIVMELADKNLWDRFKECRAKGLPGIPREELLSYMEETAEALDLMNSQYQLQHLDIKPQNLFLVYQHIKVADFGLVKDLEGMQASVTGGVTPVYAAPETFDGWVSRFSDQYSLGIVYQELLSGQRPFPGTNVRQLVMQHLQGTPNLGSLPPADQPIIARALAKKPDERHPTCRDLVQGLRRATRPSVPLAEREQGPEPETVKTSPPTSPGGREGGEWNGDSRILTVEIPPNTAPPSAVDSMARPTHWLGSLESPLPKYCDPLPGVGRTGEAPSVTAPPEIHGEGVLFPALVIGVGRLGLQALQQLRQSLQERVGDPAQLPNLRLLFLDTDPEALRTAAREKSSARSCLPAQDMLLVPLNRPAHYLKPRDGRAPIDSWFNSRMLYRIPRTQVTLGVRALGRLAFCDNYRSITRRLRAELEACLAPEALTAAQLQTGLVMRSNRPRVYVIAGLAGGTGSGMFLDLAYVVRQQLMQLGYEAPDIVGIFFMPPLGRPPTAAPVSQPGESAQRLMAQGNAFAALTELSHFATPGNGFFARYLDREPTVRDREPPFLRTMLLPLAEENDEAARREQVMLAGEFLFRDLCSPLGRVADLARVGFASSAWEQRGLYYQTFGLYYLSSPQRSLLREAARGLCVRLVQRWISKDSAPLHDAALAWVDQHWFEDGWEASHLEEDLQAVARFTLNQTPESALEAVLQPLAAVVAEETRDKRSKPRELDVALVSATMERLEGVVGWPPGEEIISRTASLPEALRERVTGLVSGEWAQHVAELAVQLIEQPEFRLAGAEEAIRHLVNRVEAVLREQEPRYQEYAKLAAEAHERIHGVLNALQKPAPVRANKCLLKVADLFEWLRCYGQCQYESLVQQQIIAAYVSLRGHLSDQLREINYCRVRLGELLQAFGGGDEQPTTLSLRRRKRDTAHTSPGEDKERQQDSNGSNDPAHPRSSHETMLSPSLHDRPGRLLFPTGCASLTEAVFGYLQALTSEDVQQFDEQVQGMIRKQFGALVHVCLTSANVLKHLEGALLEEGEHFAASRLPAAEVAEVFFTQAGTEDMAQNAITTAFDEATPELGIRYSQLGMQPPEVAVLLAPPGEAGERFRALAERALEDADLVVGASPDDIVLYRELPRLALADLLDRAQAGYEAYRHMASVEHFTPHSRSDIPFAVPR